ncbi:RNA-binding protein S4 [Cohnella kolymensis]|uniref:RNA-binding protein S4 n=1 Tax=Cohnella kolymensis TaxID=1590652 RepID=A0ABR5A5K1_9BACL|nr:S4 domain-containing protein YaaA [Cohnella kolymensis]KIL36276.1 RNA-binding protein S4 [Cohnella kolymensis]
MKNIDISTEYITLGQLLKLADCISTGGEVKFYLQEKSVQVNGQSENRRGRKLVIGDRIEVEGCGEFIVAARKP